MLDNYIRKKLESLKDLPAVPTVIAQVLKALENTDMRANTLAKLIERDQTLTAKVLKVANSSFYGFSRRISTIDLAIIIMGLNSIKEIVIGLVVQRFISKINSSQLNINDFWKYSVFCGSCSRLLARKMGYKLAGEAFVAGLMHDLGILIIVQNFKKEWMQIRVLIEDQNYSLIEAEQIVLNCTHADIGAWLTEKWNLPIQLSQAVKNHHTPYYKIIEAIQAAQGNESIDTNLGEIDQPLTSIVSMSEWLAGEFGFKDWAKENRHSDLYLASEIFDDINSHDLLDSKSAFAVLKQEIMEEYERASEFQSIPTSSLYH